MRYKGEFYVLSLSTVLLGRMSSITVLSTAIVEAFAHVQRVACVVALKFRPSHVISHSPPRRSQCSFNAVPVLRVFDVQVIAYNPK